MSDASGDGGGLAERLVEVFMRLASGDLTARMPRTFKQDHEDALAFFVDVIAEQIVEQRHHQREYEASIAAMIEKLIAVASGDFTVRAERTGRGDALDTFGFLLNNVAIEVRDLVSDHDRQRVLLETVLESMLDGVLVLDTEGKIRRTNEAMAKLLGRPTTELDGLTIGDVLAPNESGLAEKLSSDLALGPFDSRDTHFRTSTGDTLAVAVSGSPHRDFSGRPMGFVLVARDDRELRRVNAQLHLSDRLATMGTLAAGVAHEINNPLAFVSANVDYVLEEMEAVSRGDTLSAARIEDMIRALKSSRSGALRVRNIVRDLHQFARAEKDGSTRIELNALLDTALGFVQNEIRHHARLIKRYGKPPAVLANEGRLVQVFLNLILNAAQSIPLGAADKNEIVVSTGTDGTNAFVEIKDSGGGIAEPDLSRVFDLFYTTKAVGEGTGLGLSIALRLVQQAGGRIDVTSKVGLGSTFRVVFPAAPVEETRRSKIPRKRRTTPRSRVLVVDDEAEVGEAVRRLLGRKHDVEVAIGATDALALLEKASFDLVLCDLLMPDMTGMELYDRLMRSRPDVAQQIVFMTAGAFHPTAAAFLSRVKNRRFDKPFDVDTLLGLLEKT